MLKDYYKILEIEENFTEDEIKKKYRDLSKKYHPDINPSGSEKFKEISEAYDVLSNPDKRRQYNAQKDGSFGFPNMDEAIFNMFNGFRGKPVQNKVIKLDLTPIEIYNGVSKDIIFDRQVPCDGCYGKGGDSKVCSVCSGMGYFKTRQGSGYFVQEFVTNCPSCHGQGRVIHNPCTKCTGRGTKTENENITIDIPKTADNGQFLKLIGFGDTNGVEFGDLIIQINVIDSDGFRKIGNDLIYDYYLTRDELDLDTYFIPHPAGSLNVTAPKEFNTNTPLKIKNKGYGGGDFYIKLNVKFKRN